MGPEHAAIPLAPTRRPTEGFRSTDSHQVFRLWLVEPLRPAAGDGRIQPAIRQAGLDRGAGRRIREDADQPPIGGAHDAVAASDHRQGRERIEMRCSGGEPFAQAGEPLIADAHQRLGAMGETFAGTLKAQRGRRQARPQQRQPVAGDGQPSGGAVAQARGQLIEPLPPQIDLEARPGQGTMPDQGR